MGILGTISPNFSNNILFNIVFMPVSLGLTGISLIIIVNGLHFAFSETNVLNGFQLSWEFIILGICSFLVGSSNLLLFAQINNDFFMTLRILGTVLISLMCTYEFGILSLVWKFDKIKKIEVNLEESIAKRTFTSETIPILQSTKKGGQ